MVHGDQRLARSHLRMVDHLTDVVDRTHRDAGLQEDLLPFLIAAREQGGLDDVDERGAVGHAQTVADEALVGEQIGATDRRAKDLPEFFAADRDREIAGFRAQGLVGQQRLVGGAHRCRHLALDAIGRNHGVEQPELAFHHRHVDALALTGLVLDPQRQHDSEGGIHAGGHVGDRGAAAHAAAAFFAGDADHAAFGLQDQVHGGPLAIGAVLAETRNRGIDDPGIAGTDRRITQAEFFERARAEVLDHDVGFLDHLEKELLAFRALEVDRQSALVAMKRDEIGRLGIAATGGRAPGARDVAAVGRLELEDRRAVIGQHGRAVRAGEGMRQVKDDNVFKGHLHGVSRLGMSVGMTWND